MIRKCFVTQLSRRAEEDHPRRRARCSSGSCFTRSKTNSFS